MDSLLHLCAPQTNYKTFQKWMWWQWSPASQRVPQKFHLLLSSTARGRHLPWACLREAAALCLSLWSLNMAHRRASDLRGYSEGLIPSVPYSRSAQVCSFTLLPTDMIFLSTVPAVTCLLYWSFLCMFFVLFTTAFLCQHQESCFQSNSLYLMWSIN